MEFEAKNNDEICGTQLDASNEDFLSYELGGVEKLFSTFTGGVLTSEGMSTGLIKVGSAFYLFDSHKRCKTGLVDENGKTVLIRFENSFLVTSHLRKLYCG